MQVSSSFSWFPFCCFCPSLTQLTMLSFLLDVLLKCESCPQTQRDARCANCKSIIVKCSVCRIGVRGTNSLSLCRFHFFDALSPEICFVFFYNISNTMRGFVLHKFLQTDFPIFFRIQSNVFRKCFYFDANF